MISEDFKKVVAIFKKWNLEFNNPKADENFQERLKIQKLVHICQVLGISFNSYHYSLYKNGPYSPDLTNDYYDNTQILLNLNSVFHTVVLSLKEYSPPPSQSASFNVNSLS